MRKCGAGDQRRVGETGPWWSGSWGAAPAPGSIRLNLKLFASLWSTLFSIPPLHLTGTGSSPRPAMLRRNCMSAGAQTCMHAHGSAKEGSSQQI